jgi:hypothetical protein
MEILVELDAPIGQAALELGHFEDLKYLVKLLNGSMEGFEYDLKPVKGKKGVYLFMEQAPQDEEALCGMVHKKGKKAYAHTPAVHALVMDAYARYVEAHGNPVI